MLHGAGSSPASPALSLIEHYYIFFGKISIKAKIEK
jgi:hypothetical protein